jgi:transposase
MGQQTRKHLQSNEKIKLLKKHFIEKQPISEVCEVAKIPPGSFYLWQRELFDRGAAVFDMGRRGKKREDASARKIAELEAKLAQKNEDKDNAACRVGWFIQQQVLSLA